jgi:hypothetical protein
MAKDAISYDQTSDRNPQKGPKGGLRQDDRLVSADSIAQVQAGGRPQNPDGAHE